jgi:DNA polymerase-3 subunit epsilon
LKTGKILNKYHTLIRPSKPLSDKPEPGGKKTITQITGITNEMLTSAPRFKSVAGKIFTIIEKAPVVIAHNLGFDSEMLDIEAERIGREIAWPRKICSVEATIAMKGKRLSLTNLYLELFGEKFEDAHRAENDVNALTQCCIELFKRGML